MIDIHAIEESELKERKNYEEKINSGSEKVILNYTGEWNDFGDKLENGEIIDHGRLWEYLTKYKVMSRLANIKDKNGLCILDRNAIKLDNILELGSDWGHVFTPLRCAGNNVYGIEPQQWCIDKAKELGNNVTRAIMEDIPFRDEFFDLVISNHVLEHSSDIGLTLTEIYRVTKPSGYSIHTVPCRADGSRVGIGGFHRTSFNYAEFTDMFNEYKFIVVKTMFGWNHDQEDYTIIARRV